MEDKDLMRLKERLEEIFEHEVTVKQAKQVAVFVKLFVSMGADFGNLRLEEDIVYHAPSTGKVFVPKDQWDFVGKGSQTGVFTIKNDFPDDLQKIVEEKGEKFFKELFNKIWSK